jgi:hypothetical protein
MSPSPSVTASASALAAASPAAMAKGVYNFGATAAFNASATSTVGEPVTAAGPVAYNPSTTSKTHTRSSRSKGPRTGSVAASASLVVVASELPVPGQAASAVSLPVAAAAPAVYRSPDTKNLFSVSLPSTTPAVDAAQGATKVTGLTTSGKRPTLTLSTASPAQQLPAPISALHASPSNLLGAGAFGSVIRSRRKARGSNDVTLPVAIKITDLPADAVVASGMAVSRQPSGFAVGAFNGTPTASAASVASIGRLRLRAQSSQDSDAQTAVASDVPMGAAAANRRNAKLLWLFESTCMFTVHSALQASFCLDMARVSDGPSISTTMCAISFHSVHRLTVCLCSRCPCCGVGRTAPVSWP